MMKGPSPARSTGSAESAEVPNGSLGSTPKAFGPGLGAVANKQSQVNASVKVLELAGASADIGASENGEDDLEQPFLSSGMSRKRRGAAARRNLAKATKLEEARTRSRTQSEPSIAESMKGQLESMKYLVEAA